MKRIKSKKILKISCIDVKGDILKRYVKFLKRLFYKSVKRR